MSCAALTGFACHGQARRPSLKFLHLRWRRRPRVAPRRSSHLRAEAGSLDSRPPRSPQRAALPTRCRDSNARHPVLPGLSQWRPIRPHLPLGDERQDACALDLPLNSRRLGALLVLSPVLRELESRRDTGRPRSGCRSFRTRRLRFDRLTALAAAIDGPARRAGFAMHAAQIHRARFARYAVLMTAGYATIEPVPHRLTSAKPLSYMARGMPCSVDAQNSSLPVQKTRCSARNRHFPAAGCNQRRVPSCDIHNRESHTFVTLQARSSGSTRSLKRMCGCAPGTSSMRIRERLGPMFAVLRVVAHRRDPYWFHRIVALVWVWMLEPAP